MVEMHTETPPMTHANVRALSRASTLVLAAGLAASGGCSTFNSPTANGEREMNQPAPAYTVSNVGTQNSTQGSARQQTFYTGEQANYAAPIRSPQPMTAQNTPTQQFQPTHQGQPFAATPNYDAQPTRHSGTGAVIDTSALSERGDISGLQANTWADIGGGWKMVNAATTAEGPNSQFKTKNFQNLENDGTLFTNNPYASRTSRSGDMSADLYDNVLGKAIPREAAFADQGKNTENVRQVTYTHFGADFDPMVSKDGTKVIYASTQHRETADIYIKDINSRIITRLTSHAAQDVMPSISPNGRYISFASNRSGTWDLYMMPTNGGTPVQLTSDTTHDLHPSWSPDGSKIVFSRLGQTSGRWELWVMDVDSPAGLQFIGYGLFPDWSPVSGTGQGGTDQIAFQRSRERGDRAFSVWTIDYTETPGNAMRETEIISSPTHALINPSWSPDGEFVLYSSVPNNESWQAGPTGAPNQTDIWMIGNDGRGRVQLVGGSSINLMPVWGSNQHIYFVSDRSGVENLWSISVAEAAATANAQRPNSRTNRSNTGFATVPTFGGETGTD
ncbi:MAG: hypothetical protein DHS20C14_15920 [Phycisphaeraceae bacterium]|nr:MAG: hypothetical protein DHS20C14_15920 [Phycisphaeraceae bacterium]